MDPPESEENEDEVNSKPTFRIRFTIGQRPSHLEESSDRPKLSLASQNVEYCDHSPLSRKNETSPLARSQIAAQRTYRFIEPQNHKSALFVNLGATNSSTTSGSSGYQPSEVSWDACSIQGLGENGNNDNNRSISRKTDQRLFISPDLNAATESSISSTTSSEKSISGPCSPKTAEPSLAPAFDDSVSVFELLDPEDDADIYYEPPQEANDMSHCNFMNWMSATKRRASATNPSSQAAKSSSASSDTFKDLTNSTTVSGGVGGGDGPALSGGVARRASSSDGLNQAVESGNLLAASGRSASRNHLAISDSVETVCERDQTQTSRYIPCINTSASEQAALRPLDVRIDSPPPDHPGLSVLGAGHPISLDEILQVDLDNHLLLAEEECKQLEAQAQYWEARVEEMERKQFAEDVPRTLVENIIKHRKELRDLDFQLYQHQLDSEESDQQSCEEKLSHVLNLYDDREESSSPSESNFQVDGARVHLDARMCPVSVPAGGHQQQHQLRQSDRRQPRAEDRFITDFSDLGGAGSRGAANGKFGSHIKPGQENTADILSAVPPTGSLQRRQYLSKASSGTDSSEYSQLPTFDQHKHRLVHRDSSDSESSALNFRQQQQHPHNHHRQHQRQRHQQHHQVYLQQQQQQQHHHNLMSERISRNHESRQHSQQQQIYMQVDACSEAAEVSQHDEKLRPPTQARSRMCPSPIRPNHFKGEFKPARHALAQDSSSTASSSSPQ